MLLTGTGPPNSLQMLVWATLDDAVGPQTWGWQEWADRLVVNVVLQLGESQGSSFSLLVLTCLYLEVCLNTTELARCVPGELPVQAAPCAHMCAHDVLAEQE